MASGLDDRATRVLRYLVEDYIETAEPVGSRTISKMMGQALSPATLRDIMGGPRGGRVPRPAAYLRGARPHGSGVPVLHRSPPGAESPRARGDRPAAPRGGRRERPGGRTGAAGQPPVVEPGPPGERGRRLFPGTTGPALRESHARGGRKDPAGRRDGGGGGAG